MKKMKWLSMLIAVCMVLQLVVVNVNAATPELIIEQVQVSTGIVDKGTAFTATFVIKNNTNDRDFTDVYISIPTTNTNFSIVNKGTTFLATSLLPKNNSTTVTLSLVCNDNKSNQIPININYLDGGTAKTVSEQILVTLANNTPVEKVDTTKYKPELIMSAGDIQTVEAGTTKEMSITIKNTSATLAKNITINPILSDDMASKISLNQAAIMPTNGEIKNNSEQILKFSVTANGITEAGTYPLNYKIQYQNSYNDIFTTTLAGYIKVTQANNNGTLYISSQSISPVEPVRGSKLVLGIDITNRLNKTVNDVSVWVEGLATESFLYQEQVPKKALAIIGYQTNQVTFNYLVDKKAASGSYPYKIMMSYTDDNGNTILTGQSYLLYLPSDTDVKGALEITNMKVPSGVAPETQFGVSFDVTNTGEKDLENIEIKMDNSTSIWAQSTSIVQIKKLAPSEKKTVSYTLMAAKNAETMSLPVSFQIQYDGKAGEEVEVKTLNQNLGVLVNGDKEGDTKPKIVITTVETMPSLIVPGTEFDLNFSLLNTSTTKNIQNVKMTLTSIDTVTQVSNIVPIGQSDSIFIGSVGTQSEVKSTVKIMLPSTYKGNVCDIKVSFTYEDSENKAFEDLETIHLPISENIQLTASDVRLGKVLDNGYSLELDFYNTGKGILKNLMVDFESELDATNSNYFVGDLQAGRMDIYSVHINGLPPEKIAGTIKFTYEDGLGNKTEFKVPVDLTYVKPVDEITPEAQEAMSKSVKKPSFPFGIIIVVVLVVAIPTILIVRKKRKAV